MICPNCQKDIAAGSKFCYNCGAAQPQAAAAPSPLSLIHISAMDVFCAYHPKLEDVILPQTSHLTAAVKQILSY